jgi:hypothetical protein
VRKSFVTSVLALALYAMSIVSHADEGNTVTGDKATDMVVDLVVIRPLGVVTTIVGTALTVVALPITIPTGSVKKSAQALIVKPAEYTFERPLGEFTGDHD